MNIQEAKREIIRTFRSYQKRNSDGSYRIPLDKQRPLLLIGPPGIGKTAIMHQIAEETGCGILSYTMTHHTRQSAIGLPFISEQEYDGKTYRTTEYSMSEIVASIYQSMRDTGKTSGILFLDEINCVSETLSPVMLQLLQNKTFGTHALPEGWIIAAAGNPPEYNKSVRELDMATLDRVKHMEIEADLSVWLSYAKKARLHPAIISYLMIHPEHFYCIEQSGKTKLFVTARGWEDLSYALLTYEEEDEKVQSEWFLQYLQHDEIAESFALYYQLYTSLSQQGDDLMERLHSSPDIIRQYSALECLSLSSILFQEIHTQAVQWQKNRKRLLRKGELIALLPGTGFSSFIEQQQKALDVKEAHQLLDAEMIQTEHSILIELQQEHADFITIHPYVSFSSYITEKYNGEQKSLEEKVLKILSNIEQAYQILQEAPEGEQALLYLTTDLTQDAVLQSILPEHPLEIYLHYCRKLLS